MATRRSVLALAGAGVAVGLAGCREPSRPPATSAPGVPDILVAEAGTSLLLVRGDRVDRYGSAILSPRGERIYTAHQYGMDTMLTGVRTSDASIRSEIRLPGHWAPRVATVNADLVALTPTDWGAPAGVAARPPVGKSPAAPAAPAAKGSPDAGNTRILIADTYREVARFDLAGNYSPDAFSTPGYLLYVLDWLPPQAPEHYRVRSVELATGTLTALFTRDKKVIPPGAEELMSGSARAAVYSPNQEVLYTLYTNQSDHTHTRDLLAGRRSDVKAFVHTLHLAQGWAYCIDLPDPFGTGPHAGHTIAASPDGTLLYVADTTSGRLALVDTASLAVLTVVELPVRAGAAYAAATAGRLFIAVGEHVDVIERASARVVATWPISGAAGLAVDATGSRLYLAAPDAVRWLSTTDGAVGGELAVLGLTGLRAVMSP